MVTPSPTALLLLLAGAFVAAWISGAAGFGGALLLLPALTAIVGPVRAVPLLTVAQLVGNLARIGFGWQQIAWRPVRVFCAAAVPASMVGALTFVRIPPDVATRGIGVAVFTFVLWQWRRAIPVTPSANTIAASGVVVGFISGVAGSAGPLSAALFLSLGLPPVSYIASEATVAVAMHGAKLAIYQHALRISTSDWSLAAAMGVAMILGTWLAKRTLARMPARRFAVAVRILLLGLAVFLIVW